MSQARVTILYRVHKADILAFPDTFDTPVVKDKSPPFNLIPFESGDI